MKILSDEQIALIRLVHTAVREPVYLVGGVVRDLFLDANVCQRDLDFVVEGSASQAAETCRSRLQGEVKHFPDFLTAKLTNPSGFREIREVDFASARCEVYTAPGRLPKVTACPITEDLKRRDFTINAIALPLGVICDVLPGDGAQGYAAVLDRLKAGAIDLFGGFSDIAHKEIRYLHARSFLDDPTRMYRACRYAARLGGEIEAQTSSAIRRALAEGALNTISDFRQLTELKKIFNERSWWECLALLNEYGFFTARSWLDGKSAGELVCRFAALKMLRLEGQGDSLLQTFLLALADCADFPRAEKLFRAYQLPKRNLARLAGEWRMLKGGGRLPEAGTLTSPGLLYAILLHGGMEGQAKALQAEAEKREWL